MGDRDSREGLRAALSESADQGAYIGKQLVALRRSPVLWRRFRLLEIVCQRCGDALAEVMETDPHPVVCFRQSDGEPLEVVDGRARLTPIRASERGMFYPISWPLPPANINHADIFAMCSCRNTWLSGDQLYDDLRSGRRKRVVPFDATRRDTSGQNSL